MAVATFRDETGCSRDERKGPVPRTAPCHAEPSEEGVDIPDRHWKRLDRNSGLWPEYQPINRIVTAMREFEQLEILVAKIQKQLAPDAEVMHNARLDGRRSKTRRQIDVLVRKKIGQYEMLIAIECKDYATPADAPEVDQFYAVLDDIGAHKGALVCSKGFTGAAKESARARQIDLYSPVDTEPHKWQVHVDARVICDFRMAKFRLP